MAKTCIRADSARATSNNILHFPTPQPRWKYAKPDMDNPENRRIWESLIDFGRADWGDK